MKKEKEKNKKNNNVNNIQKPNLPLSNKISVQIIDNLYSDLYKGLLFKLYIKSVLFNKSLNLNTIYELLIFTKKINFVIETHNIENLSETESFMINEESDVEINIMEENLENLKLENKKEISNFDKVEFLKKNCENYLEYKNENVDLIGMDEEYQKIKTLINYNLLEDLDENFNTSLKNTNKFTYKVKYIL